MPVLFLTEEDVRHLLTMDMALEAVEEVLRKMARNARDTRKLVGLVSCRARLTRAIACWGRAEEVPPSRSSPDCR